MTSRSPLPPPIDFAVSAADVARWRAEARGLREKAKELVASSEAIEGRIEAAERLFDLLGISIPGDAVAGEVGAEPIESEPLIEVMPHGEPQESLSGFGDGDDEAPALATDGKRPTMIKFVEAAITSSAAGLPIHELKTQMKDSPVGPRLLESDKGFYRAIDRLAEKGRIIRRNGRVFSKDAFARYQAQVESGEIIDAPARVQTHSPMGDAIEAIVRTEPGIQAARLIFRLKENPEFEAALTPHTTGAYNILARLVKRGQVVKVGRRYYPSGSDVPQGEGDDANDEADLLAHHIDTTAN